MRILLFVNDFKGGAGNVVQILARQFCDLGHEVSIGLISKSVEPTHNMSNIRVEILPPHMGFIGKVRYIKRLEESINPDVVVSFVAYTSLFVGVATNTKKFPLLVSERSNPVVVRLGYKYEVVRRIAYKKADLVAVQFDSFKCFDNGRFKNKAITLPNPVIIPPKSHSEYSGKKRFVSVGNDRAIKGYDILLKAFAKYKHENPDASLSIYGADCQESTKQLIDKLGLEGENLFKEYATDVYDKLDQADIYVMPSLQEGFPNALSEAMAYGMPCIVSSCHDGICQLMNDGENGILVKPQDVDALFNAMIEMTNDPKIAQEYGRLSRQSMEAYSTDKIALVWLKAMKTIIGKKENSK